MNYGYTIARYASEKDITLTDAFTKAWHYHFGSKPALRDLWNDVKKYKEIGAVPIYVSEFIRNEKEKHEKRERFMANPLFRALRSIGLPTRAYT